MKRREFLRASAGAWATRGAAAAGVTLLGGRRAEALDFGDTTPDNATKLLPVGVRAESVLECFLYGGLTTWETFYCVPEYGRPDDPNHELRNTQYYTFNNASSQLMNQALSACGVQSPRLTPFGLDAAGHQVNLGPFVGPLVQRPDVVARTRVVVNRHDLEPHEAAIPYAVCGKRLGQPSMACLGAHVQRYFIDHGTGAHPAPFSYTFATNYLPSDNVRATTATGTHPGAARPLLIKVDAVAQLETLLGRPGVGSVGARARYDALLGTYLEQYGRRLRWRGAGVALRAPAFSDVAQAAAAVSNVDAVSQALDPALFDPITSSMCGDTDVNIPAMSLRLAAHLLTHPTEPARYCCFVDPGLETADGGGGYDTHMECSHTQSRNFFNTLTELLSRINKPGEDDPTKIDLDKTMVVLNMEFGRSPTAQDGGEGRNHWPYGYVQVYFGGPIGPDQKGVYGAIDGTGQATTYTTPAENRMACLLALGIWPFAADSFGVSDVQGGVDEVTGVESITSRVLGRSV